MTWNQNQLCHWHNLWSEPVIRTCDQNLWSEYDQYPAAATMTGCLSKITIMVIIIVLITIRADFTESSGKFLNDVFRCQFTVGRLSSLLTDQISLKLRPLQTNIMKSSSSSSPSSTSVTATEAQLASSSSSPRPPPSLQSPELQDEFLRGEKTTW